MKITKKHFSEINLVLVLLTIQKHQETLKLRAPLVADRHLCPPMFVRPQVLSHRAHRVADETVDGRHRGIQSLRRIRSAKTEFADKHLAQHLTSSHLASPWFDRPYQLAS